MKTISRNNKRTVNHGNLYPGMDSIYYPGYSEDIIASDPRKVRLGTERVPGAILNKKLNGLNEAVSSDESGLTAFFMLVMLRISGDFLKKLQKSYPLSKSKFTKLCS